MAVDALRPRFPGYDVKAELGWDRDDVVVYEDGERLLRVVAGEDDPVLTVHVTMRGHQIKELQWFAISWQPVP